MTRERFEALVARLEQDARADPAAYRRRVLLLALLGYGYVGAVLLVLLALLLATLVSLLFLKALAIKLIIPVAAFIWVVLKAMWVRLDPPSGQVLRRQEVPALFELLDGLGRELRAPRFDRVLLTDEFNAAVVQRPRLGLLGWYRNYLLIGLPLMKALTVPQFKAVLAHELGHLAGGHARLGGWVYRLRAGWSRLLEALESEKRFGTFMFRPFFRWYAPYFAAYSFPLARADEYEADAAAARLTSPDAVAEALGNVSVVGAYLGERYWPGIHRQADELPQPAFAPYSELSRELGAGLAKEDVDAWLGRALERATSVDDTHPSLSDRLAALDVGPRAAPPSPEEAADRLLGRIRGHVGEDFDRRWKEAILPSWRERHREVAEGRARLAELEARVAPGVELSLAEAVERARLTEDFGAGAEAALEQFRALHAAYPQEVVAKLALGLRLLARDEDAGVPLVLDALAAGDDWIEAGAQALRDYHWRAGREDEARQWHQRLLARQEVLALAREERSELRFADAIEPHGLAAEVVEELAARLRAVDGVRRAWLVRKRVRHLPGSPLYILALSTRPWWRPGGARRAAQVQARVVKDITFPGEALVFNLREATWRFSFRLRRQAGARLV